MTGFAVLAGEGAGFSWTWEGRSVNGKGLDLRLKLPEGIDGLEGAVRSEAAARFTRGNLSLALRLDRTAGAGAAALDSDVLERVLSALTQVDARARGVGLELRQSSAAEILSLRGVMDTSAQAVEAAPKTAILSDLAAFLDALAGMRATEGQALARVLEGHLAAIESLTRAAAQAASDRVPAQAEALRTALARVMENADGADPARVAQELALIAVKSDVTEELDRLHAHIAAARALLAEDAAIGRRLDFLSQEFNREANTLASKSGFVPLTRVALDLKAAIDQFREQVQNVE